VREFINFIGQEWVHQYFMAIGGSIFWVLFIYNYDFKSAIKKGEKWNQKEYVRHHIIDWILIFLAIGIMVPNMGDIVNLYNKMANHNIEPIELFYYCPGPFTDGLYLLFAKLYKLKQKIVSRGHH